MHRVMRRVKLNQFRLRLGNDVSSLNINDRVLIEWRMRMGGVISRVDWE